MLRRCALLLATLGVAAVTAVDVLAQTSNLRSRVEQELFTFGDCGEPLCLDLDNIHGDHFLPGLNSGNAAVISFVTDAIGQATSSVPLSATSGGATFSFVGGLPVRTSTSAGPIFGERSQTLGRGRFFLFDGSREEVRLQFASNLFEGLVLDLTHTLLGDTDDLTDLLECERGVVLGVE